MDILRRLKIEYPLIQAPMAGISTPALAATVSNEGALGSIAIGSSTVQEARELISATRQLTERSFNVNVFCHKRPVADPTREEAWLNYLRPFFDEFDASPPIELSEIYKSFLDNESMFHLVLEARPAIVSFHFGLPPTPWIMAFRNAGIATMACVTNFAEAQQAEKSGVDFLVAQGIEAGGHRGVFQPEKDAGLGVLALIRTLVKKIRLPVIAAGGIMDGQGMSAALQLGAVAVQMGTAFLLTPEVATDKEYRSSVKSDWSYHTQITSVISGRPARGIINRFHTEVDRPTAPPFPDYPIAYDAAKALAKAAKAQGSSEFTAHWAGQGAPLARELPAAELVRILVKEWRSTTSA